MRKHTSTELKLVRKIVSELSAHVNASGLRHKHISNVSGIDANYISAIIHERKLPSLAVAVAIGDALGLKLVWRTK
jgi:ABC-type enterobactin transport system permease subunit